MRWNYAESIWRDAAATLDDLREAVATLEDIARTTRRVLGSAHPTTTDIERDLQNARVVLRARETHAAALAAAGLPPEIPSLPPGIL